MPTIRIEPYGQSIPISREQSNAEAAEWDALRKATARRRWKLRHRMDRAIRRTFARAC